MEWRLRHAGSPHMVPVPLTMEQIIDGLKDGVYDPSDEVRGPKDKAWVALEKHPLFEDPVETIEEIHEIMKMHEPEDENIDMNPLIDVCLVLLVFFILATTLSILDRVFEIPKTPKRLEKPPRVDPTEIIKKMIRVEAERKDGRTIIKVEEKETKLEDVEKEVGRIIRENVQKTDMFIDPKPGVEWNVVAKLIDVAREHRMKKVNFRAPPDPKDKKAAPAK